MYVRLLHTDFTHPNVSQAEFSRDCPAPAFPWPGERRDCRALLPGEQMGSQTPAPVESGSLVRQGRNVRLSALSAASQKC